MDASGRQEARQHASEDRAEAARRTARGRRLIGLLVAVVVLVIAAGVTSVILVTTASRSEGDAVAGRTSAPPWPAPADVEQRAEDAGLSMLTTEGEALHIHEHLSISVDGRAVTVPALIGIDEAAKRISPIHTHDTSGIIHVESPVVQTFHLGQVFTEWDVALAKGRVGNHRDGQDGARVAVFVDGKPFRGDPGRIVLGARQDIDVVVTTDGSVPTAPTTAFAFPDGY
jgi:hypothetical protein